ncbi:hypothetical protein CMI37_29100 [Candidatus Pacearchaeota archaeon]|jgi:hypothetical protein|nr:hypothetical protein [Candidatus Pacearchaeota archaeon]HCX45247.1 hypothetical protein [Patescibacteria group bacterium]|tara:strand:+ start:301 stop:1098 length:798 start_codon:yes stop_codon:yes gene_type:complete
MENNNNNLNDNLDKNSQPVSNEPNQEPRPSEESQQPIEMPAPTEPAAPQFDEPATPEMDSGESGPKWIWAVIAIIIIAVALQFAGVWNVLGDKLNPEGEEEKAEQVEEGEEVKEGEEVEEGANKPAGPVEAGKGKVVFNISAAMSGGNVLVSGEPKPNVEIRKVSVFNPFKNDYLLVYDGFRPLDLRRLTGSSDAHALIETNLIAIDYSKVKIEFADLLNVDENNVSRVRTIEMDGVSVKEGENNVINIKFNIDDLNKPFPFIAK